MVPMSNNTPFCNPCQSYHSTSQPCFNAATAQRVAATPDATQARSRDVALHASVEIASALSSAESGWRNNPTRHEIQDIIAKHCDAAPRATGEATVEANTWRQAIAIVAGFPTERYSGSGAHLTNALTFRDGVVKALEAAQVRAASRAEGGGEQS